MSAIPVKMSRHRSFSNSAILPRVWATASIGAAADAVQERKRPHCLRLVRAAGLQPQLVPALSTPRVQRKVEPGLVFYRQYTEGLLRRYLRLPEGSAFGLFALGRTVGWIAHALEQRETGQLIRPRAVYVGAMPEGAVS